MAGNGMPPGWLDEYWGNVSEGRGPSPHGAVRHRSAPPQSAAPSSAQRTKDLAAQRLALRNGIIQKMAETYMPSAAVNGREAGPRIDLDTLNRALGVRAPATFQESPGSVPVAFHGLPTRNLTPAELEYLGIKVESPPEASAAPLGGLYGGG